MVLETKGYYYKGLKVFVPKALFHFRLGQNLLGQRAKGAYRFQLATPVRAQFRFDIFKSR
jgi:hypothetical protein